MYFIALLFKFQTLDEEKYGFKKISNSPNGTFYLLLLWIPISSYSFRGNYSFLNLEIQRSQNIRPKVTVHKGAETIQGRKLFKGGNYMRKYGR